MFVLKMSNKNGPCLGADKLRTNIFSMIFHDFYERIIKKITTSPPQALFGKTNIQQVMFSIEKMLFINIHRKHTKGPSSVKANELYSQNNFETIRIFVQVLSK